MTEKVALSRQHWRQNARAPSVGRRRIASHPAWENPSIPVVIIALSDHQPLNLVQY